MSTIRIPVRWNATAKCPRIDSFLIEVLPGDSIELVLEVVGYCMIPDNRLQRAVMLVGPGGNGKSTLLNLIRAFLGAVNVSARSLHDLGEDRFAKADLVGRLANICGDLDARAVERSDTFKMITGGDAITAERKYGHSFSFTPFTRLLFSANEVPLSADQTQAYFDRWLAIPMVKRFRDTNDEDHDLLAKLTTDAELEGLLVQAVEGLRRLIERGHFDVPASIKEEQKRFRQQIDTVIAFVGDACVLKESRWERRTHLYAAYQRWCQNNGRKALASRHVYFKLRDHFLLADKLRDGYDGFDGIGFVDEAERHLVTP